MTAKDLIIDYENEKGTLHIYSEDFYNNFIDSIGDETDLVESLYFYNKDLFDDWYGNQENSKKKLREQFGNTSKDFIYKLFHNSDILNWTNSISVEILNELGYDIELVELGVVSSTIFNAIRRESVSLGLKAICVNYQILRDLHQINALWWRITNYYDEGKIELAIGVAGLLEKWAIRNFKGKGDVQKRFFFKDTKEFQLSIATSLIQTVFILLHEYGHFYYKHTRGVDLSPSESHELKMNQEKEADNFAIRAIISSESIAILRSNPGINEIKEKEFISMSLMFLFSFFIFLKKLGIEELDSHPLAKERFSILEEVLLESNYIDIDSFFSMHNYFRSLGHIIDYVSS